MNRKGRARAQDAPRPPLRPARRRLVCVDTRISNDLFAHWLGQGLLAEFAPYPRHRREVTFGRSRFDFLLEGPDGSCFVEVKSCTLARRGRVEFPDAPTERGARHLRELVDVAQAGMRACVVFCLLREDGEVFSPADDIDRRFGRALRQALCQGVEAFAYQVRTRRFGMSLAGNRPILPP
ncbi:MAG: DNA/RNA nuclease SfsA [Candidatus Tectomicrobia bacterium]|nr:DNA/RNA nuclease SfsA [Candidatus Tectomicrobia bacterium]